MVTHAAAPMAAGGSGINLLHVVRRSIWIVPFVLGLLIIGAGIYLMTEARSAKQEVLDALASENITTPADAAIPNVRVTDAETARVEMDWLEATYLEFTGGTRYAELELDDPNREFAFEMVQLRTSLHVAVVDIRAADLAIALGLIVVIIGATFVMFMAPAVYYAARGADHYDEPKKRGYRRELHG